MHKSTQRPIIPEAVYSACSYFLPRLMFLSSRYAGQTHWGDIVIALQNFPQDKLNIRSDEFWESWLQVWRSLGDDYCEQADQSNSKAGKSRLYRSATACYHWAEFKYFSNQGIKRQLRANVKKCFQRSLANSKLNVHTGELTRNNARVPYYLVLPETQEKKMPCVILSNGLDSITEVEVFAFAEYFLERGIATLLFDGPGQGINIGEVPMEIEFEGVVAHLVDFLKMRSSIDEQRLGFFGVSYGGYLALRVAKYLGPIFNCVVNLSGGPVITPFDTLPRRLRSGFKHAFIQDSDIAMEKIFAQHALNFSDACDTSILSVNGGLDDVFPIIGVEKMDRQLGTRHTFINYPGEAHVCLNYINQYSAQIADWVATQLQVSEHETKRTDTLVNA